MLVRKSVLVEEPEKNTNIRLSDGTMLSFDGNLTAAVWDEDKEEAGARFSGEIGRFNIHRIYLTSDGKHACVHEKITRWTGEMSRTKAIMCSTTEEIVAFFGSGWLAQELYARANISL